MDLTGGVFLTLLVVVTVAAAAAIVAFWSRLASARPRAVLGRIGALVTLNLLVLVSVAAVANNTFGFFADWTDLAGAFASAQQSNATTRGASASAAVEAPVSGGEALPTPPASLPPLPVAEPGQRRFTFSVPGARSGLTGDVVVEVPASYGEPASRTRRYPVVETFPGYPGNPHQWLDNMGLGTVLDDEATAGRIAEAIVVSPTTEIPAGRDTECVDGGAGQEAMETWLTVDVPAWIIRTFRVKTDRASWAVAGLSAGGFCAAMAVVLHPARYGAALVFGGYFSPQFGRLYRPFPSNSDQGRRYDLVAQVSGTPPPVALWLETSHSDKLSHPSTQQFVKAVRPPLSVHLVEFAHASHSLIFWSGILPDAVRWLGSEVPGFRHGA